MKNGRIQFLSQKWNERLADIALLDHSRPDDFEGVTSLAIFDPTLRHIYLDWVCRAYIAESFVFEDVDRVRNTLSVFHRFKRRMPEELRDIGRYRSEQDLWEVVEQYTPQNGEEVSEEGRALKRKEKAKALSESEFLESGALAGWTVATPITHYAAQWWSKGTRWCTGMASPSPFNNYSRQGPLRVLIAPDGSKYQAHSATLTFCDAADRRVDVDEFLNNLPAPALELLSQDALNALDTSAFFPAFQKHFALKNSCREQRRKA